MMDQGTVCATGASADSKLIVQARLKYRPARQRRYGVCGFAFHNETRGQTAERVEKYTTALKPKTGKRGCKDGRQVYHEREPQLRRASTTETRETRTVE
jgi:hypothetical protein